MIYTVAYNLPNCTRFPDRKIGSNWCTNECAYCKNVEKDIDYHGRTDSLTIFCDPFEINCNKILI